MNYRPKYQLPPPSLWQEFETLCLGLWKTIWGDQNAQKNGRQGQSQHGVDVFGQPKNCAGFAGVQCKGKENFSDQTLSKTEVSKEVKKAKKFRPNLLEYTIATTAPKDVALQEHARKLTISHKKNGLFTVSVCGWDDIEDLIWEHQPPIACHFYPTIFGGELTGLLRQMMDRLPELPESTSRLPTEPCFATEGDSSGTSSAPLRKATEDLSLELSMVSDSNASGQIRAKDIRCLLPVLVSIQQELVRQSGTGGSVSSDDTLAAAVDRAIPTGRDTRSLTDNRPA